MKKSVLGILLIILIGSLFASFKFTVNAENKTWIVDLNGGGDFTKIQDAVNGANSGDTIFVRAATYEENVILNTSISLIGEERETTIIDVRGIGNPLEITANGTIVSGLTFGYGETGIVMTNSHNNLITGNVLRKNSRGIGGSLYTNTTIENTPSQKMNIALISDILADLLQKTILQKTMRFIVILRQVSTLVLLKETIALLITIFMTTGMELF